MIEKPSKARSTIIENFNELEIIIPTKKSFFAVLSLSLWMIGWFVGEIFALSTFFFAEELPLFAKGFIVVWVVIWSIGGFFSFSYLLWLLSGKEIIEVENGILNISKAMLFFRRTKTYDIYDIKHMELSVQADDSIWSYNNQSYGQGYFSKNQGKISFDYGYKTVRFANDIDKAEARKILEKFKQNPNFKKENFEDLK